MARVQSVKKVGENMLMLCHAACWVLLMFNYANISTYKVVKVKCENGKCRNSYF